MEFFKLTQNNIFKHVYIKRTKNMARRERQNIGFKLNYVIVWTESGIRGDPDRVGTTRQDPEYEPPSHRPLFLPDWPGIMYSQCCGPRS
jgi:hypothetical protein